jgi:hypothetical protein
VSAHLDVEAINAAGAAHGALASSINGGGVAISAHKIVEEGARALLVHVPGLFRFDARPDQDSLAVDARELTDAPCEWTMTDLSANYNRAHELREPVDRLAWDVLIRTTPHPIRGRLSLNVTNDRERGLYHFAAHAILYEAAE